MTLIRRLLRALLHLLAAFALLVGLVQLFRLGLLPWIQSGLGLDAAATGLIRRSGIVLCALLAYTVYVRWIERRAPDELRPAPRMTALALVAGVAMVAIGVLPLYASGVYAATGYRGFGGALAGAAGVIVVAALMEEIVYRGLLFRILENACGSLPALWLQALVFALMHIANVEGEVDVLAQATTVASVVLLGALWTLLFVHSRNLWVVAAHHAAWNYAILLTGLPLSGLDDWREAAPLASVAQGPDWLTGGAFGPENAISTMLLVAAVVVVLFRLAQRRGRYRAAGDPTQAPLRSVAT